MRRRVWMGLAGVAIAVVGFVLGRVERRSAPGTPAPETRTPDEIGVSLPEPSGGRTYVRFVVGEVYDDSAVQPEVRAGESVCVLYYLDKQRERYHSVYCRGFPIPKPGVTPKSK